MVDQNQGLNRIRNFLLLKNKIIELRIRSWSSTVVNLAVKGFTETEFISLKHTTNSDRSIASSRIRITSLPELINVETVFTIRKGNTYIIIDILVEGDIVWQPIAGYLTQDVSLSWPPGKHEHSIDRRGKLRNILGSDPAAGSEISETVPTNAVWKLRAIGFRLVTDANVATRRVELVFSSPTIDFFQLSIQSTQVASQSRDYSYGLKLGFEQAAFLNNEIATSLPDILLRAGAVIETNTISLQIGDDYGRPQLLVEEWIEEGSA